ncbi:MAG: hypothetical protein ACLT5H_06080 [Collinsella stercoris]
MRSTFVALGMVTPETVCAAIVQVRSIDQAPDWRAETSTFCVPSAW